MFICNCAIQQFESRLLLRISVTVSEFFLQTVSKESVAISCGSVDFEKNWKIFIGCFTLSVDDMGWITTFFYSHKFDLMSSHRDVCNEQHGWFL